VKTFFLRWPTAVASVVLSLGYAPVGAQAQAGSDGSQTGPAGSLTLSAVYDSARARSPRLAAARAMVVAAQARTPQAGAFPDPTFGVGVGNLELPGLTATMPASMAPLFTLGQGIPFPGKRGLREDMAGFRALSTASVAEETWWQVRSAVGRAFFAVYEAERQLVVQVAARGLLEEAERIAQALYASGSGRQTDVLRASVAVARLDGEVHRLEATRTGAAARLNGLLNFPADRPIPEVRMEGLPSVEIPLDTLEAWAQVTRPAIRAAFQELDRAESAVELAHKDIWPDLTVGLQYAQRPTDDGRKHMGGAVLGFSIPVFAGSKQHRARDEAEAERLVALARVSEIRAAVGGEIGRILADLERGRELLQLYDLEILPQARATVASALSSYRSGGVDFLTLLDADLALTRFEVEFASLVAAYGVGVSELEAVIGRPHASTETLPWGIE